MELRLRMILIDYPEFKAGSSEGPGIFYADEKVVAGAGGWLGAVDGFGAS